jgi:hypothetical protein
MYSLGTAAKATGKAKSSILRAIKSGRISATRTDSGWSIDPAELHRIFPLKDNKNASQPGSGDAVERDATYPEQLELFVLKTEIRVLQATGEILRSQVDDVRRDRDSWRELAQAVQRQLRDQHPWWRRLLG